MKTHRFLVWDAFTDRAFEGNPCGIVPDADDLSDETMLKIARELNLPETSFVLRSNVADFRVRYFMPRGELGFAGHPTIATAFMLAKEGMIDLKDDLNTIKLEFKIGVLPVDIHAIDNEPTRVVMTLSSPTFDAVVSPEEAAECFANLGKDDIVAGCEPQVMGAGTKFLVIPLNSLEKLRTMEMNRPKLTEVVDRVGVSAAYLIAMKKGANGDVLCARLADPRSTFEDPFTGSGMGAAGVYLVHNGMTDQSEINLEQGEFVGRPGFGKLFIKHNNRKIEKIQLAGRATRVSDGLMFFDE